jgi:hypothetical protein
MNTYDFCDMKTNLIGRIYYQDDPFVVQSLVDPGVLPIAVDAVEIFLQLIIANKLKAVTALSLIGMFVGQILFGTLGLNEQQR